MKRIANDVALETILYGVSGLQKIMVVDYPNMDALCADKTEDCSDAFLVFSGEAKDLTYYTKARRCAVKGIKTIVVDGYAIIIFQICSQWEQF